MQGQKIEVIAYAGHCGEEAPRSFMLGDEKISVIEVQSQWIEEDAVGNRRRRCFRIKGSDSRVHLLAYEEKTGTWYLE